MSATTPPNRCRLVLTLDMGRNLSLVNTTNLAKMGDIASVILYKQEGDFSHLQKQVGMLVDMFQTQGVAVMIAGDSQMVGRLKADGLHIEGRQDDWSGGQRQRHSGMMLGVGAIKSRHEAMEIGEQDPDYVMFGKLGADKTPEPHPRNLTLGGWWASMVEIPCIVQAGSDLASVEKAAATGAEFVALEEAVFAAPDMLQALKQAGDLLDRHILVTGDGVR